MKKIIISTSLLLVLSATHLSAEYINVDLANANKTSGNASDVQIEEVGGSLVGKLTTLTNQLSTAQTNLVNLYSTMYQEALTLVVTGVNEAALAIVTPYLNQIANAYTEVTSGINAIANIDVSTLAGVDLSSVASISDSVNLDSLYDVTNVITGAVEGGLGGFGTVDGITSTLDSVSSNVQGVANSLGLAGTSNQLNGAGGLNSTNSGIKSSADSMDEASSTSAVVDIGRAYRNERKWLNRMLTQVSTAAGKEMASSTVAKNGAEVSGESLGQMMNSQEQSGLLDKQMSNYTKMEIQRAESLMMQTTELIMENAYLSGEISKEEILDMRRSGFGSK